MKPASRALVGPNKSLGRHIKVTSNGRSFDPPLIPKDMLWPDRIRRRYSSAGIAFDEPHLFGCFVDDRLVAVARCRRGWEETAHIGVVTHPAYRGCRYGSAVVSAATAEALDAGFIGPYQTLLANAPSVALATRVGYREYATHVAIRLISERR